MGSRRATVARKDPLAPLHVIKRLTVGPVRLEGARVRARYAVTMRDGTERATDFIYRFEEGVFHPDDPVGENLAAMLAAQPALNYGLFADEIRFIGPYDRRDVTFLREMAANTACEIYVKKFLEPNPFLTGRAGRLPFVKRSAYLRATITVERRKPEWERRPRARRADSGRARDDRYVVLSSGGKESLLSYGLLREITKAEDDAVHPVFVNESGRHWYTALNSYRTFVRSDHNSARVWTNSDRIYGFMNRLLPFVRKDFAQLRADDYPIQLWTLAIFLFGTLPIARTRGAGRIIVGDEYDTTRLASLKGIKHYDGVFDQSRFFDEAVTRYCRDKKWGFHVLSLLRPLSEMLVQKILVQRYPSLQKEQVSCHAAHLSKGRVRPCGRCEKCRRVVGMLVGVGADPRRCGYTAEQIERNIRAFARGGLHQEGGVSQHVAWLLAQAGRIRAGDYAQGQIQRVPTVETLRFDRTAAPRTSIPSDIRPELVAIYRAYTQ